MSQALILVVKLPESLDETDNMQFTKYFNTQFGPDKADLVRDVKSEQFFWVVHIVDAYRHNVGNDAQDPIWTVGYAHVEDDDKANTIYHNVIDGVHELGKRSPTGQPLVDKTTHVRIVVAHEALHRFVGYHTPNEAEDALHNSYIMSYAVQFDKSLAILSGKQLRAIQDQKFPK